MSWQQRLREMVIAGGAGVLTVVGCGNSTSSTTGFCCNANSDPCCSSMYCGGTVTAACSEKMTCEADGGTWDWGTRCSRLEDSGPDAVTNESDGGTGDSSARETSRLVDSGADVSVDSPVVPLFCCNANPDPCCRYLHCGDALTVQCTEKMACDADGGTWSFGGRCVLDAGADGNGQSD